MTLPYGRAGLPPPHPQVPSARHRQPTPSTTLQHSKVHFATLRSTPQHSATLTLFAVQFVLCKGNGK